MKWHMVLPPISRLSSGVGPPSRLTRGDNPGSSLMERQVLLKGSLACSESLDSDWLEADGAGTVSTRLRGQYKERRTRPVNMTLITQKTISRYNLVMCYIKICLSKFIN